MQVHEVTLRGASVLLEPLQLDHVAPLSRVGLDPELWRTAILRLGAVQEGIFRKHMITDFDRFRDSVYFSILDTEWPGVKQRLCSFL